MSSLLPPCFCLLLLGSACAPEHRSSDGKTPVEELFLLFPRMHKEVTYTIPEKENFDVGLDFDGPAGSVTFLVSNGRETWNARRLAGSTMRLVVCGVTGVEGRLSVRIRNHRSSSCRVALRLATHKSDMCSPLAPVSDEYWALFRVPGERVE